MPCAAIAHQVLTVSRWAQQCAGAEQVNARDACAEAAVDDQSMEAQLPVDEQRLATEQRRRLTTLTLSMSCTLATHTSYESNRTQP